MKTTINQISDNDCTVAVLAMILNISYDESFKILQERDVNGPPFGDSDVVLSCFDRGIYVGMLGIDYSNTQLPKLNKDIDKMGFTLDFLGNEFYIAVDSLNYIDKTHVIYWDGEKLHDPSPKITFENLGQYHVLAVWPIIRDKKINGDINKC